MSSTCRDKGRSSTLIRILFHDANEKRKSIYLGKVPIRVCDERTRKVAAIESCIVGGVSLPSEVTTWLRDLPECLHRLPQEKEKPEATAATRLVRDSHAVRQVRLSGDAGGRPTDGIRRGADASGL
jgi:hypothetical protein